MWDAHEDEEGVETRESRDLDVFVEQRSGEPKHPERYETEVSERLLIRFLTDSQKDLPGKVKAKGGGSKTSLGGRREGEVNLEALEGSASVEPPTDEMSLPKPFSRNEDSLN